MKNEQGQTAAATSAKIIVFLTSVGLGCGHVFSSMASPYYLSLHGDAVFFHQATRALIAGALQEWPLNATLSPVFLAYLSFFYQIFPDSSILSVKVFQILLNAGSSVLIFVLAKNLWNLRAGFFAGMLSAFCGVFIFYSVDIAKPTLVNFLLVATLYFLFSPGIKKYFKILIVAMLWMHACLLRMNLFLFSLWILFYLLDKKEKFFKKIVKPIAFTLVCISVSLFWNIWMVANIPHNRAPMSQWGIHFYIGNQTANKTGVYQRAESVRADAIGHSLDVKRVVQESGIENPSDFEINKYWFKKGLQEIRNSPMEWLALMGRKSLLFFNAYEIPSYDNFQYVNAYTPFLKFAGVGAWVIIPLGLLGVILSLGDKKRNEVSGLRIFLLCYFLTLLLTFMRSDYRLPVYPVLLLFCGYTLDQILSWVKSSNVRPLCLSLVVFMALFYLTSGIHLLDSEKYMSRMQKRVDRDLIKNRI